MNGPTWLSQGEPLITDWMQGWGSVLGLAVSLIAVAVTATLLWHEIREARRGREAASRERAEAQQDREAARRDRELAAGERADLQMAHAREVVVRRFAISPVKTMMAAEVTVANYGMGPILNVEVGVDLPRLGWTLVEAADTVAPSIELETKNHELASVEDTSREGSTVVVRFTDMAGLRWERRDNGQPVRLTEEYAVRHDTGMEVERSKDG